MVERVFLTKTQSHQCRSVGYHSDDGKFFNEDGAVGINFADPYGVNTVIGCGIPFFILISDKI